MVELSNECRFLLSVGLREQLLELVYDDEEALDVGCLCYQTRHELSEVSTGHLLQFKGLGQRLQWVLAEADCLHQPLSRLLALQHGDEPGEDQRGLARAGRSNHVQTVLVTQSV